MLALNDGRDELWQWDTGRTLTVDPDCSQVHFRKNVFDRSIDVDVVDGVAIIPDILLQTDKDLIVWAFSGTAENGYTKISKTFKVNRRNKPADYVFTPVEQTTIDEIAAIAQSVRDDADAGMFDATVTEENIRSALGYTPADKLKLDEKITAPVSGEAGQTIRIKTVDETGHPTEWEAVDASSGGVNFTTDETLSLKDGVLSVNTAQEPDPDNTLPITSAAVHTTVGNIEILLKTI